MAPVLVLAAALRFWGAFDIPTHIEDEAIHAATALSLGSHGTTTDSNWAHPPLSGLLILGSISLFGDNPHGWRSSNLLLGTASVLLLFLIGARLYPGTAAPLLAASLLAFDPFHVFHSRTTYMEVPVTFFFLLYLHGLLAYDGRNRWALLWAGVAAGLTAATKAYFVLALPVAAGYAFLRALRGGEKPAGLAAEFVAALILLPTAVFLLCHLPWFARGFDLPEFFRMKADALLALRGYQAEEFLNRSWLEAGGKPWEWFLKPIMFGKALPSDERTLRLLLEMNNFPFRLLSVPALLFVAYRAWRQRQAGEALAPSLFVACYVLFLAAGRPLFSYSALVALPFAYLALARAVDLLSRRLGRPALVPAASLAAVVLWGAYLYPLAAARAVPRALYEPILPLVQIVGGP